MIRALDKREYFIKIRDNFYYFCMKTYYVVTPHLNCLGESVQMKGHNMISVRNKKNYPAVIMKYPLLSRGLMLLYHFLISHWPPMMP